MGITNIVIWVCLAIIAICIVAMIIARKKQGSSKMHTVFAVVAIICFVIIAIMHLINGQQI